MFNDTPPQKWNKKTYSQTNATNEFSNIEKIGKN